MVNTQYMLSVVILLNFGSDKAMFFETLLLNSLVLAWNEEYKEDKICFCYYKKS